MRLIYSNSGKRCVTVDDDDFEFLSTFKWYIHKRGYALAFIEGKSVLMHRLIMQPSKHLHIDHIDRDKTNNQRSNLRIVSKGQNAQNIAPKANNTSGFVGVSANGKYWQSSIYLNKKRIFVGNFKNKKDAALAYNKKALELYGTHAYLNVI